MKKVASIGKKLIKFNIHTHSNYCDGNGKLLDFIAIAQNNNFDTLGFSSHAPLTFDPHFSINRDAIPEYVDEISSLQKEFPNIQLLAGMECDFIPTVSYPFSYFKDTFHLDYLIGGIHLVKNPAVEKLWFIDGPHQSEYDNGLKEVFQNDIKKGVTHYYHQMMEMIDTQNFEVLAHLDKIKMHNAGRFFSEEDLWYKKLCLDVVDLLKSKDIIVEINTRGIYKKRCPDFYPSKFILENLLKNEIKITISSDAHQPMELDFLLEDAANYAKEIGFQEVWKPSVNQNWCAVSL